MLFKKIIYVLMLLFLGLAVALLILYISLPRLLESEAKKRTAHMSHIFSPNEFAFSIKKMGFSQTFISDVRVGKGISIDSIAVNYDVRRLPDIDVSKVTLSGLTLHALLDENNQIRIPGIVFPEKKENTTGEPDPAILPFLPGKVVLNNSRLVLGVMGDEFTIPVEAITLLNIQDKKITARIGVYPFGEKVSIRVAYDLEKGIEWIKIEGKSFDPAGFNRFFSQKMNDIEIKGPMDFHMESSSPGASWHIEFSKIGIAGPVDGSFKDITADLAIDGGKLKAQANLSIAHSAMPELPVAISGILDLNNDRHFTAHLESPESCAFKFDDNSLAFQGTFAGLSADFAGTPSKAEGRVAFAIKEGRALKGNETFRFDTANISSTISTGFKGDGLSITSAFNGSAKNARMESKDLTAAFPSAGISGSLFYAPTAKPSGRMNIRALIKSSKGRVTAPSFKTRVSGISLELPVQYPFVKKSKRKSGRYTLSKINYKHKGQVYGFSSSGKIYQTDTKKFKITSRLNFSRLPGLKVDITSRIAMEKGVKADIEFKTNSKRLTHRDIQRILPGFSRDVEFRMVTAASGGVTLLNHQLKTSLFLTIRDGSLTLPEMDFTAKGINTSLMFNDLIVPESVPGQTLTIDSIRVKKFAMDDINIRYSIEDAKTLLMENVRFKWCNGVVSTEAVRIPNRKNTYHLVLYCDRLDLTELLKQVGAFHAEGKGTLSGRIPVDYNDGEIGFDNGFLFSSPGSGGNVVIRNSDIITKDISRTSPQFSQLDLAQEALKDFDYKWAKLVFNTFEDILYVTMELDGKPAQPLPFEYRKEIGGFVRVGAASPGSHFQGIKLDVNLQLPFNEVMKFGTKLKSLLDNKD